MKITNKCLQELTEGTWEDAVAFLEANATKADLLEYDNTIPDFEGNDWKKIEGIKFILANYDFNKPTQKETKMKKLNKTQTWELIQQAIENVAQSELIAETKVEAFKEAMLSELSVFKPTTGGSTSSKVNENGEVYCNYFEMYKPADEFATKLSKPDKITGKRHSVYKANCRDAEIIIRAVKSLKNNCETQVMNAFKAKHITADEMAEHLNNIDNAVKAKYNSIKEVPKSIQVLGLEAAMGK